MANIEALEQLKRVVRTAPEHQFNMGVWHCDTVRCAIGWATVDPWFRARGLGRVSSYVYTPYFNGLSGFEAAANFFGVTIDESKFMLGVTGYGVRTSKDMTSSVKINICSSITRDRVIDHIDQVIENYSQKDAHVLTWRNYLVDTVRALTMLDEALASAPRRSYEPALAHD